MSFLAPSMPAPPAAPPPPPPPPPPPSPATFAVKDGAAASRAAAAAAGGMGFANTIKTGPDGTDNKKQATAGKTLFGGEE